MFVSRKKYMDHISELAARLERAEMEREGAREALDHEIRVNKLLQHDNKVLNDRVNSLRRRVKDLERAGQVIGKPLKITAQAKAWPYTTQEYWHHRIAQEIASELLRQDAIVYENAEPDRMTGEAQYRGCIWTIRPDVYAECRK